VMYLSSIATDIEQRSFRLTFEHSTIRTQGVEGKFSIGSETYIMEDGL